MQTEDPVKAIKKLKAVISNIQKMKIEEQKKAVRSGYDMDILPTDIVTYEKDTLEFLDDFHRSHSDDPLFISVSLENTVARKMYSDIGFQEVKEVEYFFLGKVCREIQMRKDW